jgi:hypothetical protein
MKKLALTIVCAVAVTGVAFAQGTVTWLSIPFTSMTAQTNSVNYSPLFGGGTAPAGGAVGATASASGAGALSYYYELLYTVPFNGVQTSQPGASVLFGGDPLIRWINSGLSATNSGSATAGRLSTINPNTAASVPWANGVTNNIMLVGWSANLGTSWAVVSNELAQLYIGNNSLLPLVVLNGQNAFFGESGTGFINPNLVPAAGATLFNAVATANGSPIYSLNTQLYLLPVPEPATLALAGLGGLSLLLFRRQRK